MNTRSIVFAIIIVVLVLAGVWYFSGFGTAPAGNPSQQNATTTPETSQPEPASKDDLITLDTPLPGASVASPLTIRGQARGTWYFEASFPVKLLDGNGKVLAQTPAQAQGDWMTTEYVPFSATLTFAAPTTATGTLVLEKDNPSGLPQNANELRVPVTFGAAQTGTSVKLYYYNPTLDQGPGGAQCSSKGLVAVTRTLPRTQTPLTDAITELLRGALTATERAQGIQSEFPLAGVTLKSATISNGAATLTFADPQNKTGGGSCRVSILRAEIEATAKQFPTVTSVTLAPAELFQP